MKAALISVPKKGTVVMLTLEGCQARRARLFASLDRPVDYALVFDPQHQMYFANYYQTPFVFRTTNAAAVLILAADGRATLVCDNQLQVFAQQAFVDEIVAPVWYRGRESAPHREAALVRSTLDQLAKLKADRFGYEAAVTPVGIIDGLRQQRSGVELTPIDAVIHHLKRAKDPDEVSLIRRSLMASDLAFNTALAKVRPGMKELEVFQLVQDTAQQAIGEAVIVYGDFVSGPRCQKVGGPPSDREIEPRDLVLLDFSVVVRGYRGDCANTFVCGGRPSDEERRLYDACLAAMATGESLLKAGQSCRGLYDAVRDSFASRHLADTFHTHAGHGIGLGHPDPPYIVPESSDTLLAGDVITLEPGQYHPGVAGMRYERNYLITDTGYELLSHLKLEIDQEA